MSWYYPSGTYVPIGTYDRPEQEQAALDAELADLVGLPRDEYYAAIAARMGVTIDASDEEEEPKKEEEEVPDPWTQFLIDQESPNIEQ